MVVTQDLPAARRNIIGLLYESTPIFLPLLDLFFRQAWYIYCMHMLTQTYVHVFVCISLKKV